MSAQEINKIAEKFVETNLRHIGYFSVKFNTDLPFTGIIADGMMRKILVQVKAFKYPTHPQIPTESEIKELKKNAEKFQKEPWAAIIQINDSGETVGNIQWINLSKEVVKTPKVKVA